MSNISSPLSPSVTDSFAYITFRDRLPVIITRIVDYVYRNKNTILDRHVNNNIECVKYITSELSRLRHELTTDKIMTNFDGNIQGDEALWNNAIIEEKQRLIEIMATDDDEVHWYKTSFLFGENYMYRRIWDIVIKSGLDSFDPFCFEKEEQLLIGLNAVDFLSNFLQGIHPSLSNSDKTQLEEYFEIFLKISLWANEADLSLSVSESESKMKRIEPRLIVENNNSKLLVDDSHDLFDYIGRHSPGTAIITVVLDNCATELLADLHFVEFLLASNLAATVVLMVKSLPWYVSDTTAADVTLTLAALSRSPLESLRWLARSISLRMAEHRLVFQSHAFFTLPYPFHRMHAVCPDLYAQLAASSLVVFKGDLNYRKLVGDLSWHPVNTTFKDSLLGFHPAPIAALRVLKCNVQVGLTAESLNRAESEFPTDWMVKSRYGVVQTCGVKD